MEESTGDSATLSSEDAAAAAAAAGVTATNAGR